MSNKEQRKAPVLRFKGFTDDWEQRKFGDFWKLKSGKAYKASEYVNKGIPIINGETIKNGEIKSNNLNYLPKRYLLIKDNIILKPDDVVIGLNRPIINNQLKISPIPKNIPVSFLYQRAGKIESKFSNLSTIETYYLLERNIFNFSKITAIGSDQPFIKTSALLSWKFFIPKEIEEKTINKLLAKISTLIFLQQRKLDELIQIKEGIGQGLLNRHYRNLSIRFNQENSPWKQTKLGKIASFVNGRAFKQKELMNRGLYPVLRVGNFYTNNKWYYSNLNLSPDKYANKGDLLYTWSASFGPHVWKGPKVIYHYHIWKINFDPAVISKAYLYEFLKLDKKEILANSNGSTMIHITKKDMENKMITVPDMNEQIKIGKILEKLDLKIELNKNKLNNLKSVKQFLLQKMFM